MTTDARIPVTLTERSGLLLRMADSLIRYDIPAADPVWQPMLASLMRFAGAGALTDPLLAFEDLVAAQHRLSDVWQGVAERNSDADLDLAERDRDDCLWTCLWGPVEPCPVCRRAVADVACWRPAEVCEHQP